MARAQPSHPTSHPGALAPATENTMEVCETIENPAALTPPAPDWPARLEAVKAEFIEMGMHADYAAQGAWWRVVWEAMQAGDCDAYDAEVILRQHGVQPPEQSAQRWVTVRNGDYFVPGTHGPPSAKQVQAPLPPRGRTAAEFMTKRRQADLDRVLWAWRDCHGASQVKPSDVHDKVRAELAGERIGEWSDHDINRALDLLVGLQLHDGRQFQAIGPRGLGKVAGAYVLRFPEPSLRGPVNDPTFAPWLARITEHTLRLRDDPAFMPGEELSLRMACADREAFNDALTAYAAEIQEAPAQARRRFDAAGIGN